MSNRMMPRYVAIVALATLAVASGCGGRSPNPVAQVSIYDRYMSCDEIRQEVAENYAAQSELVREQVWAEEKNDMIMGIALAFPPAWFAIDKTVEGDYGQSPQEIEGSALATRARYLIDVAQKENCWPDPQVWSPL